MYRCTMRVLKGTALSVYTRKSFREEEIYSERALCKDVVTRGRPILQVAFTVKYSQG